MKWIKAAVVGAFGSLVMFGIMMVGIHVTGIAPFNIPPSAAFLEKLGINVGPLPLLVHFGYGAFWSMALVFLFRERTNFLRGLLLADGLWLFMMLVYSPLIGWGLFGFGNAGNLAADHPLYLEPGPKYLVATLVLHFVYGGIIGTLNPLWIKHDSFEPATAHPASPSLRTQE